MANSSRQSGLFGVSDWKAIYQTFREADFRSYDYETLRKSFVDYLQATYPETYNDYVESSEFVALLDVIAFMGQGLAFRSDLNARENFIDTAERRDSVVKLANLVSYTTKRNLAAQGFLKITSIQTTQNITDFNGVNLSNIPILWNDPANPNWLEQFNTIINAALIDSQKIGTPGNSKDILGVLTNEYSIRIPDGSLPIAPFSATVDGQNMNFELVSATSAGKNALYEIPPSTSGKFNVLHRVDRMGYGSPNTGYFFMFKQGSLQTYDFNLEQQIHNQTVDIGSITGVNDTDTWLYQIPANDPRARIPWTQVDNVYAGADVNDSNRKVYSVTSRFNDQVTYVFGDGVFSESPIGRFRAYVRSSNGQTYVIDPSEMQGIAVAFSYVNRMGRTETLTIGLELTSNVSNAKARETIEEIKLRAPTRYYTQNRMVSGEDYNNFPFTAYNSIIKSKALNRSSIGVSRNLDLLDPTGKYSSTMSLGTDGAVYQDDNDGNILLTINNISDILAFLHNTLASVLLQSRTAQYYIQTYPRYDVDTTLGTVYWHSSIVNSAGSNSGYVYNVVGNAEIPAQVGTFTTDDTKYITEGAMVQFMAPTGYYFDATRHLVVGIAPSDDSRYIWATVTRVIGDGSNTGSGNLSDGSGPITLSGYVPSGAIVSSVIPVFSSTLSSDIVADCINRMELQQDFTLAFDNSLSINESRWSIQHANYAEYFVKFVSLGNNRYSISYKSLAYFFGSVSDTRFAQTTGQVTYDPFTGKTVQDNITVLGTNTRPASTQPLGNDVAVNVLGQRVESDGYVNDFHVEVSASSTTNSTLIVDPDFFTRLTGYRFGADNNGIYVFFREQRDAINLTRNVIVPTSEVVHLYPTKSQIETVKYDYPVGQLFYAYSEGKFFQSVQAVEVRTPYYTLEDRNDMSVKPGRQGVTYQYKHTSNNTTRIDPATTNIIDIYVVTQAYYDAYQNWIRDVTNTVVAPKQPTIAELSQEFGKLQDYKMLSDSAVLNSVVFKPLFGSKADPALQGTIKVVKQRQVNASDSEIKSAILAAMNNYFDINNWNFGDTFFFSELSAFLHTECGDLISSVVLVPNDPTKSFGDLYEIKCMPYEIFVNAAVPNDVVVVTALTPAELQMAK